MDVTVIGSITGPMGPIGPRGPAVFGFSSPHDGTHLYRVGVRPGDSVINISGTTITLGSTMFPPGHTGHVVPSTGSGGEILPEHVSISPDGQGSIRGPQGNNGTRMFMRNTDLSGIALASFMTPGDFVVNSHQSQDRTFAGRRVPSGGVVERVGPGSNDMDFATVTGMTLRAPATPGLRNGSVTMFESASSVDVSLGFTPSIVFIMGTTVHTNGKEFKMQGMFNGDNVDSIGYIIDGSGLESVGEISFTNSSMNEIRISRIPDVQEMSNIRFTAFR